ncbi:MAG: FAD binding domain-containing protein [Acidimicrobiales bacterium]
MPLVAAYFRPDSLDEALSLLAQPNRVPLAGGTTVNADRAHERVEVVDLQALGLSGISADSDRVRIGATTTLAELADSPLMPAAVQRIAKAEEPSTLRTLATVGGTVASGNNESVLTAALLVCDAQVELAGADNLALTDLLASGVPAGAIITAVTVDPSGDMADAATGRTPADVPIVAAVARKSGVDTSVALTGVADTPVLVDPADPAGAISPPDDFRGSSSYRLELARVLTNRAIEALR